MLPNVPNTLEIFNDRVFSFPSPQTVQTAASLLYETPSLTSSYIIEYLESGLKPDGVVAHVLDSPVEVYDIKRRIRRRERTTSRI
jgi:hypothetical protein